MAAVITAPQSHRPRRSARPTPGVPTRPALRVLDGGRRPGEPIARSPRPVASRPVVTGLAGSRPGALSAARPTAAVYRRRRIVAVALVLVAVATVGLAAVGARAVLAGGVAPAAATAEQPTASAGVAPVASGPVHVVQPGDTLWSIAEGLEPSGDVRALVDELADRAGPGPLQAGERIPLDGLVP